MPENPPSTQVRRAIEDSFPIVEINRLAVPERNSFKPIYQMHKWFARRASCVFRAILLGCLKPIPMDEQGKPTKTGAKVIMDEFYKDHTNDPDTKDKVILDPFMGGGTTVVEALRLGCRVIGIDLNPVAWFIVKTEVEPVGLDALKDAFERLAERVVPWSGKSVRETLLSQYRTECPCCGSPDADIVYTFWVRLAVCIACKREVPLHHNHFVTYKEPSIRYYRDVTCPCCSRVFDWEIDPAVVVADERLQRCSSGYSAGTGRSNARWALSNADTVRCPWCDKVVSPVLCRARYERKKVSLAVLLCPHCGNIWQWRGQLPDFVNCPTCGRGYSPDKGTLPDNYDFVCFCGTRMGILESLRRLGPRERRRLKAYAIAGYCPNCDTAVDGKTSPHSTMFETPSQTANTKILGGTHSCCLRKNKGRFFEGIKTKDIARHQQASQIWDKQKESLLYPCQEIPYGYQTVVGNDLPGHGFLFWHDLFNQRQLLCLSTLITAIQAEADQTLREMLLSAFFQALRNNCLLCFYNPKADKLEPALSRKDFAPPKAPLENSVWGTKFGRGTFASVIDKIVEGKAFCTKPCDRRFVRADKDGQAILENVQSMERISAAPENLSIYSQSSTMLSSIDISLDHVDFVVTDPPYAGNVNYSEVADFFYVWLRLLLAPSYPCFAPEFTPKAEEIVAQEARGRSMEDFRDDLTKVFSLSGERVDDSGLLVFTFHHEANAAWEAVLGSVMSAGFTVEAVYPYESEARKGGSMGAQKIAYDLIHVCRKRDSQADEQPRSWAGIRQEIRRRAREEIAAIEAGRYGSEPLSPSDVNIIMIGKCLELYSRHYGAVIDHEGKNVPLHHALKQIRDIADQMTERERPLPSELEEIDPESRVYLRALSAVKEVKSDDVHKATRGILEPADLIEAGLMTKMRAGRGRSYEVKQPADRLTELMERFGNGDVSSQRNLFGEIERPRERRGTLFIDRVHLLLGLVEAGENILPWLERFRGETPQIRAALEYIENKNKNLALACRKVLGLLEVGPLFKGVS